MAKAQTSNMFIEALRFVSSAQKPEGAPHQRHIRLANYYAVAFDGIMAMGAPIQENMNACPQTILLIQALNKCGDTSTLTMLDSGRISVKSGKFRAVVPCFPPHEMMGVMPDPACGAIDDRLKQGFTLLNPLIAEGSPHVLTACLALNNGSMCATNRSVITEYWHGIHLPGLMLLPKIFITTVAKTSKNLVSFGFSHNSFTVYFADGCWIKTQLYVEKYPDIAKVLDVPSQPLPIPEGLFEAVQTILPFAAKEDENIRLRGTKIQTHNDSEQGAYYEIFGVPPAGCLGGKDLLMIKDYATQIDFVGSTKGALFFGENIRGAIVHKTEGKL